MELGKLTRLWNSTSVQLTQQLELMELEELNFGFVEAKNSTREITSCS